jgi:uncharacterized Zn-binding protein involved in type VI secretion
MPPITRLGDNTEGHGCYPARPSVAASGDVFANGIGMVRLGDAYDTHCCGPACHDGVLSAGSPNVFVNGKSVGRIGDPVDCGDTVAVGSGDVFAN